MLARLIVHTPYVITIPKGEQFTIFEYEDDGYKVRIYPPAISDRTPEADNQEQFEIDGVPAIRADTLQIDFVKESFDRGIESPIDPPEAVINRALNSFLLRLRHVARAPQLRPLSFPLETWRIEYLNEDESELDDDDKYILGRVVHKASFSWITLNKAVWDDMHNLPHDFEPLPWDALILDANAELPSIGAGVVLALTALEVFISQMLDHLATLKKVPMELWTWINQRGDRQREPTLEEQYDTLLKFFTDHSLKEEQQLWESFKNLKTARNSFVHEGIAKIGNLPINEEKARNLINSASMIIQKVKEWLPEEMHWPEYRHKIKLKVSKKII